MIDFITVVLLTTKEIYHYSLYHFAKLWWSIFRFFYRNKSYRSNVYLLKHFVSQVSWIFQRKTSKKYFKATVDEIKAIYTTGGGKIVELGWFDLSSKGMSVILFSSHFWYYHSPSLPKSKKKITFFTVKMVRFSC